MTTIEENIRKFGQKRDVEGLQEYMEDVAVNELVNLVEAKVTSANFTTLWDYILQGLAEGPESHVKRFKVVKALLQELDNKNIAAAQSNPIIIRMCMELAKFKTGHLVDLCNYCITCIQSQKSSQLCWKEMLPELLNEIVERNNVEYNDTVMSGLQYKNQVVNSICALQWPPDIVTILASMFIDMPLTKEEHLQVVNKLGQYLEKMTPQEIPPFVYQLLRLCKRNNGRSIFLRLQNYFGTRIYENITNLPDSNSDNTEIDSIESASEQDTIEAESTVLYHIHASAALDHNCIKDYLSSLKHLLRSPEFILHPFQLNVLLTISTISQYEERVFEIIRSCVSRSYHEEQKKTNSAWFREMVPSTCNIDTVFIQIVNMSAQDKDLVLEGLVNFAFLLLGVGSALGRDIIAEKQWQLGSVILLKIIKRKRLLAPVIIQQLSNRIITGHSVSQYIECMYMLCKNLTLLMLENKSTIVLLMEGLVQMPGNNANQLLDAIVPLAKVSPTIRDHLILLLRKALYSRITETRQMAVNGFLKLLKNLKISNLTAVSQCTYNGSFNSGHSLFTQISLNRASQCAPSAFSNEALCLEILSILRRCFMQQPEVRTQLYEGLHDAVCLNPELGVPVLEVILLYFSQFYVVDDEMLPPLKFDIITNTKDVTVTLQEPLGRLVYVTGLIVTRVAKADEENATVVKFLNIFDSLCARLTKCELVHFDLDDGTDLLDIMPESQHKLLVLKEAMSVYEALIGYKIYSWEGRCENSAQEINGLFQGYSRLLHFSKNLSKQKKKQKNKDTSTQSNATIQRDGHKQSFKLSDTVLDFQVICKIMNLLHEPMVTWTSAGQANLVKSKRDFHQHMMQATLNLITAQKHKKILDVQDAKMTYGFLSEIAMVLYERIIKRFVEFIDFDCTTAILAIEGFLLILNIICSQYKSNVISFLSKVGGRDREEDLVSHLTEFVETYQKLFELDEDEVSDDSEIKKLPLLVINTLSFLMNQMPVTSNTLSIQMLDWLKNYTAHNTISSKPVVTSFINLLFECNVKYKESMSVFEHVAINLGDIMGMIDEETHNIEEFKLINSHSANNIFLAICSNLKSMMEDIDWIIARLKAEYSMITYPGERSVDRKREYLKSREKGVSCHLCFVITILTKLSNCTIPAGNLLEAILKNLSLLYCTLTSLAKYFVLRSSKINPVFQAARFEKVVKLAGKELAPVVYKLIMYIEESQKQEVTTSQPSKNRKQVDSSTLKNKVLKETRLIPKVVYEIEQFSKYVIQLSNITKIDLSKLVGQGTVRDFRILHLKEVMEQSGEATQTTQESDSSLMEVDDGDKDVEESLDEDSESPPSPKKSKR